MGVRSEAWLGSTFCVTLALREDASHPASPPAAGAGGLIGFRVLAVDDLEANRRAF